ncbi:restriction endonuclease subunit S [Klebsiella aerogenes]
MSSEFPMVSLEQVSSKIGDGIHGTPKYDENGSYYFINGNNLSSGRVVITTSTKKVSYEEYVKHKKEINSSTILLSINGTIGNVAIYNHEPIILGKSACYINVHSNVNVNYIGYVLKDKKFQNYIKQQANGSTIKNVSLKLVREFKFPLPPKLQQDQIAGILCSLDKKITINEHISQTLQQMAQALFKSWFVDFEPVKAKIAALDAGGSQKEATLAAMSVISGKDADALAVLEQEHSEKYDELKAIAKLFPAAMQESDHGDIPVEWTYTNLSSLALLNSSSWSKKNAPDSLNYVDLANTKWGIIHSIEQYLFADAPSRARRVLKAGDTIVGTVRPGNGSYAFITENNLTGSTGFAVLTPKEPHFSTFVYICATSEDNIERLAHLADGGAYPAVNSEVVLTTPCIIPADYNVSKKLISIFHHYTKFLFDHKKNTSLQNKTLEEIRDVLLPNILCGKTYLSNLTTSSNKIKEGA